jgi:lipopolysaccharide/colanic/teichoic acid biosynthesis glycosyltransferase
MPAALPLPAVPAAASRPVPARPDGLYAGGLKRACDLVVGLVLLVVLSPLILATALLVWLAMGRPIFFLDRRSGRDGMPFTLVKFRSMLPVAEGSVVPVAEGVSDGDRLTPFGRVLRRTSLDELPQLVNVVIGDMSLVGPRPLPERYLPRYSSREAARLLVRPGLTGWAQIHGRNSVEWPERLELDVRYVEMLGRWYGPLVDLWIVARTAVQILVQAVTGRGVSAPGQATMPEYNPDAGR